MHIFWDKVIAAKGKMFCWEIFHHAILSSRVAEYMKRGNRSAKIYFPHWHLHTKLSPRRIVFMLFLASLSLIPFLSIFAALSPEVENLK